MINVAVGILIHEDPASGSRTVLLCQRKQSARYALKWEFPGGKVEQNEHADEALRRELFEELEIHASVGTLYHQQQYTYPDNGTFDVHYYLVPHFTGEIRNRVFETCEWVPIARLSEYDILEGNRDVVTKLIDAEA
jgi:8-oxo-dGTP diphosphatase